jgi:hypothetical protein
MGATRRWAKWAGLLLLAGLLLFPFPASAGS